MSAQLTPIPLPLSLAPRDSAIEAVGGVVVGDVEVHVPVAIEVGPRRRIAPTLAVGSHPRGLGHVFESSLSEVVQQDVRTSVEGVDVTLRLVVGVDQAVVGAIDVDQAVAIVVCRGQRLPLSLSTQSLVAGHVAKGPALVA